MLSVLQARLLQHVNLRIENGEYTERGFARLLGISQPQMHNVRKGARKLSVELADRMMAKLGISALHLMEETEALECLSLHDRDWLKKALRKPPEQIDPRAPWRTKTA